MKLQISDIKKKDIFINIFQLLKNSSEYVFITFYHDKLNIQGMDISKICFYNIELNKNWFDLYEINNTQNNYFTICIDIKTFCLMLNIKSDEQILIIEQNEFNNDDSIFIYYKNSNFENINIITQIDSNLEDKKKKTKTKTKEVKKDKNFNKEFKLTLLSDEYIQMEIPNIEYDIEFSLSSKQINDIFSQLMNFGSDITFKCNENNIDLISYNEISSMVVNIPVDDLNTFSIMENQDFELNYSLTFLNKLCITNKLTENIEFNLSKDSPMKINYSLDNSSFINFYITSKIN